VFTAKVIYAVWWNKLTNPAYFLLKLFGKKIVATISNDLKHQRKQIQRVIKLADHFVCANTKQRSALIELGVSENSISLLPFFVDSKQFKVANLSKDELCSQLGIEYQKVSNKVVIGSFQRDSVGEDLDTPKWQKNPDLLLGAMKRLTPGKFVLLLAGPRRHYLVNRCRKEGIEYLFLGDESYIDRMEDDLEINNLPADTVNALYNLIDVYIVSSASEGGPKAIIESVLAGCDIVSTDVGFAKEMLSNESIYEGEDALVEKLESGSYKDVNREEKTRISNLVEEGAYSSQLELIIRKVLN